MFERRVMLPIIDKVGCIEVTQQNRWGDLLQSKLITLPAIAKQRTDYDQVRTSPEDIAASATYEH